MRYNIQHTKHGSIDYEEVKTLFLFSNVDKFMMFLCSVLKG